MPQHCQMVKTELRDPSKRSVPPCYRGRPNLPQSISYVISSSIRSAAHELSGLRQRR